MENVAAWSIRRPRADLQKLRRERCTRKIKLKLRDDTAFVRTVLPNRALKYDNAPSCIKIEFRYNLLSKQIAGVCTQIQISAFFVCFFGGRYESHR